jgi:hypothetical protein
MKYTIIIFIGLLGLLTSCHVCKESTIATKHFETEFDCPDTKHSLVIDLTDNCTLIQTKTDYDNQVSGTCHPEIDFDMYSLVIGRQSTTREVDTIYYDYGIACPDNELTLTIEIVQGDAVVADNVVYHALIPRLKDGGTIAININIR